MLAPGARGYARSEPLVMVWLASFWQVKFPVAGLVDSVKLEEVVRFFAPFMTTKEYTTVAPSLGKRFCVVAPGTAAQQYKMVSSLHTRV